MYKCGFPWAVSSPKSQGDLIGIVVGDRFEPLADDQLMRQLLLDNGFRVEYIEGTDSIPPNGYFGALVLSPSMSSSDSASYLNIGTPILTFEEGGWDDMILTAADLTLPSENLNIITPNHPIIEGLPTSFGVIPNGESLNTSAVPTSTLVNATVLLDLSTRPVLFLYNSGDTLFDNSTICQDTVVAFGIGSSYASLNTYGKKIFIQSIKWLISQS